ncbi:MAG: 4-alpha-glucanotransferase [Anaerococcus sp.]|nr:4-alpha-glucanotransferase [Anaerococcus sp.]
MEKQKRLTRGNGVILPIFSLPSKYGIGTFGKAAYDAVDFLSDAGVRYWQILPLGPTSYGDSPYQSFSSFAGNPYFIDLDFLIEDGLLKEDELDNLNFGDNERYVDYGIQYNLRYRILEKAYDRAKDLKKDQIEAFRKKEKAWLEDYALFMAIKREKFDVSWLEWDDDLKNRKKSALKNFKKENEDLVNFYIFLQYEFFSQWDKLKKYANRKEISIIGDLPIYVALDSADAWVNSDILQLDEDKNPILVGGAPPDSYSEDGQLWGNPLYDWEKMSENSYEFWIKRIGASLRLYDILRLDHFRGFEAYYAIPFEDDNARFGKWLKAKPYELFDKIKKAYPDSLFIAEDLGYITKEVDDLKDHYGFPGMNVIQFSFGENFDSNYLPHNYKNNSVVYGSTHDSDTLKGFLDEADEDLDELINKYFDLGEDDDRLWKIIRGLMASVSDLAIFEIQDFLAYGNESKINSPGSLGDNWKWRMVYDDFSEKLSEKIKEMSKIYGRFNNGQAEKK